MPNKLLKSSLCFLGSFLLCSLATVWSQDLSESQANAFFESRIRPIFEKHCLECHSGIAAEGDLDLSNRGGWQRSGAVKPGDPKNSLLAKVITSQDPEQRMPPATKSPLNRSEIQAIVDWIESGAYDPREATTNDVESKGPKKRNRVFEITDEDRRHWAFQPLKALQNSELEDGQDVSKKIDLLVGNLDLPNASPRERIRRAYLSLWGLPPTYEQVKAFEEDPSSKRWATIIEELLSSHHYAERWGRHWLDWVRFAETNGYERDGLKPHAWRYRDYAIESFAKDKPYNQFIIEQLAGDQWAEARGYSPQNRPELWRESIIATGFYRLHVWDDEPDDTLAAEFDDADDVMVTIGSAFLGLTIGCARCHDHKFDPISQRDYYSLLSFIRGIDPYGLSKTGGGGRGTGRIQRYLVSEEQSMEWEQQRQAKIEENQKKLQEANDPAVRLNIEGQIKSLRDMVPPFEAALSVWESSTEPKPTFLLHRGDPHSPREQVESHTPEILPVLRENSGKHSRLKLAEWIADDRNPLTARVLVNRIWQRHFGVGIVASIDDFGNTGSKPSNPELLDFLAGELISSGWSIKHLHRIILASDSYSRSSRPRVANPNSIYSQPQLRRLDAETIRDTILSVSGKLNDKNSGPSIYPSLTQEIKESANPVSVSTWQESPKEMQNCRSVYLMVKRSLKVPFLETLDFANSDSPTAVRTVTTTAPQALLLLNDPWIHEQAEHLAQRIAREAGSEVQAQVNLLWQLAYQRNINTEELATALQYINDAPSRMVSLCRAVLNSSEFLYMD